MVPSGQQQPTVPQTSYLVVDEQQPGTSRQLHFTISQTKAFNPPPLAQSQAQNVHTTSQASQAFWGIYMSYQEMGIPQPLTPTDSNQHASSLPTTQQLEPTQLPALNQSPSSHSSLTSSSSRLTAPTSKRKRSCSAPR